MIGRIDNINRLSEVLNNLQKSLECIICLELITAPTKTRCGHSFCKSCIGEILQKKDACCPLCKKSLNRRNVSKDDHLQACIEKFTKLVIAIQIDTHIDILSYSKQPRDTKESCFYSDVGHSSRDSNKRKSLKERSIHQLEQSSNQMEKRPSTSRGITDCDNPRYASNLLDETEKSITSLSLPNDHLLPTDETEKTIHVSPNVKVRTWLHAFPDEPNANVMTIKNEIRSIESKISPIDLISDDDNEQDGTVGKHRAKVDKSCKTSQDRKQKTDYLEHINENDTSQVTGARQFDKLMEIDPSTSGCKYNASHARIRAKNRKENAMKSSIEKTNNQPSSSPTTANQAHRIDASQRSSLGAPVITEQSSANWSRVIEFGKEMKRTKKRKVKKLDVSIEKNKNVPRIIESVTLSPSSKYDPIKIGVSHNTSRKEANVSSLSEESSNQKQDAVDKTVDLSNAKIKASSETNARDRTEIFGKNKVDNSTSSSCFSRMDTSHITLEEGRQVRLVNLNNDQVNQIIGNLESSQNRCDEECDEENAMEYRDSSLSPRKRLTILTPEKLNESLRSEVICDDFANSSGLPGENRTPGKNNDAQRTSEKNASLQLRSPTPNKARLSLRRKLAIGDNRSYDVDSPLLSQLPLLDRLSIDKHKRDLGDSNSSVPMNDAVCNRLTNVRRDLSSEMQIELGENQLRTDRDTVSGTFSKKTKVENNDSNASGIGRQDKKLVCDFFVRSKKLKNIRNEGCESPVKFMQLGTLNRIRRHRIKYSYLGVTKREQLMPAEFRITPIHNMQQFVDKSEIVNMSLSIATSPNPSNDSHESINVTVIENIRIVDNSSRVIPKNAELSTASPTCKVSATSTPKKDIDRHLNRKNTAATIERSPMNANQRSNKSLEDVVEESARSLHAGGDASREISRVHSSNSIKLLSPDKDSQLKFLTIDSPMSEHGESRRVESSTKTATKGDNFSEVKSSRSAASTSKTRGPSYKKRKRTRLVNEMRQLFDDESSDSVSDSSRRTIKLDRYNEISKDARSVLDANKKRRLTPPDNQDVEVISVVANEQDTRERKFKRIIPITGSDTESESTAHIAITNTPDDKYSTRRNSDEDVRMRTIIEKWSREDNATQKKLIKGSVGVQDSAKSMRYPSQEKPASHRSSRSSNALETEKRKNPSQKSSAIRESDMFESSSMFNSENVDYILRQSTGLNMSGKTLGKIAEPTNDDIINRVLQIDRSQSAADVRRSPERSARRNDDGTSQRGKDSGEYLLQDNFDEIIANVELPQSGDIADRSPGRNLNRPLAEQRTPNCRAMTDEPCGAVTQQTPATIPASSTNYIFEHCSYSARNVRKPSATNVRNSDKENVASYSPRKHDYTDDRRDRRDVTASVDEIDKDSRNKKITSLHNTSREREKLFEERNVSMQSTDRFRIDDDKMQRTTGTTGNESKDNSFEHDTLMNVTQHQAQLQIFEEDLFGIRDQQKVTKIASQDDDPFREESCTPRKRNQKARDKDAVSEEYFAEEDDIVENTPERKMSRGNNVKTVESRRNIALSYLSPISKPVERTPSTSNILSNRATPTSAASTTMSRFEMHPLCQSTPNVTSNFTTVTVINRSAKSKETELVASGSILLARPAVSKTPENIRQQLDGRKLAFVCSGLTATQTMIVKELAARYNVSYASQFSRDVTHVIVNTIGERNAAKSTLKFLQGIAHRKWIVSYRWIEDCIKQQRLLDEVPYEATTYNDELGINNTGPRNSRLRKKDLFKGFTFLCVEPYVNVSLSQYQDLLLATGAAVVDSLEILAKKDGMRGVVIQDNVHDDDQIEYWYRTAKAAPILVDWIVECIGHYKLSKLAPYIQSLPLQHVCAIGYPRELVGEDEEYSYDDE